MSTNGRTKRDFPLGGDEDYDKPQRDTQEHRLARLETAEGLRPHQAEHDRLQGIIEKDTLRIVKLEEALERIRVACVDKESIGLVLPCEAVAAICEEALAKE